MGTQSIVTEKEDFKKISGIILQLQENTGHWAYHSGIWALEEEYTLVSEAMLHYLSTQRQYCRSQFHSCSSTCCGKTSKVLLSRKVQAFWEKSTVISQTLDVDAQYFSLKHFPQHSCYTTCKGFKCWWPRNKASERHVSVRKAFFCDKTY